MFDSNIRASMTRGRVIKASSSRTDDGNFVLSILFEAEENGSYRELALNLRSDKFFDMHRDMTDAKS